MYRKFFIVGILCFTVLFLSNYPVYAQDYITGPWLWMIAPTEAGRGGAASTDVDSLSIASGGAVTETMVATYGVDEGDPVGNFVWTSLDIRNTGIVNSFDDPNDIDNVTDVLKRLGWTDGPLSHHSSYALINLESQTIQNNVTMAVGSDDSIKVWLNGEEVFKNAINRGSDRFQDRFQVNLNIGNNLLLVKVSQALGNWSMFVGIDANVSYNLPSRTDDTIIILPPMHDQHEYIYWSDLLAGKIQRANLDGSNVQDIITGLEGPRGIALDSANGRIYWNDSSGLGGIVNARIMRANFDGSNIEILVTEDQTITEGMALDLSAGKMYWIHAQNADLSKNRIMCANLDGTNVATVVTGLQDPRGLAIDASNGKMYWTDVNKVQRSNLDGTNIEDLVTVPGFLAHIDLDLENQTMYWANFWQVNSQTGEGIPQTGKIQRANLDGSNVVDLLDGLQFPAGITVDLKYGKIYWNNINFLGYPHYIQRANLDGSNLEVLISGLQGGIGIAISTAPEPMVPLVDTTVSFSPSPAESPFVREQLTVDLNIVGGENIAGYQATIQYDETALRFLSNENGNFLLGDTYVVPPVQNGNSVTIGAASYVGETEGDGTLASLTFEVVAEKESSLILTEVLLSDSDGVLSKPLVEIGQITKPKYLKEDVNKDGVVNVLDLVLVGRSIGASGQIPADVNRDGSVNVLDLVLVGNAIGKTASAPTLLKQVEGLLTRTMVEDWLREAQKLNLSDPTVQRGVVVLENLLKALTPKETALLPNYPSPFNPETWIPYQLANPADVTLHIYGIGGNLVRTLSLGHKGVGTYYHRNRAAHWDGRNDQGELVASGVYFYTLTAGDFTATRKMLILK